MDVHDPEDDAAFQGEVRDAMRYATRVIPVRPHGIGSLMTLLISCSLNMRTRLDSLILSARAHVPTVVIADDPKTRGVTASIGRAAYKIGVNPLDEGSLRGLRELILVAWRRRSDTSWQRRLNRILPALDELAVAALSPR